MESSQKKLTISVGAAPNSSPASPFRANPLLSTCNSKYPLILIPNIFLLSFTPKNFWSGLSGNANIVLSREHGIDFVLEQARKMSKVVKNSPEDSVAYLEGMLSFVSSFLGFCTEKAGLEISLAKKLSQLLKTAGPLKSYIRNGEANLLFTLVFRLEEICLGIASIKGGASQPVAESYLNTAVSLRRFALEMANQRSVKAPDALHNFDVFKRAHLPFDESDIVQLGMYLSLADAYSKIEKKPNAIFIPALSGLYYSIALTYLTIGDESSARTYTQKAEGIRGNALFTPNALRVRFQGNGWHYVFARHFSLCSFH